MKPWPFKCFVSGLLSVTVLCVTAQEGSTRNLQDHFLESLKNLVPQSRAESGPRSKFSLRKPSLPEDDLCYIVPGEDESLHNCNFNRTAKTFLVIHGWTVSGLFESWVSKMVAALYDREKDANVVVVDWLDVAQNHYSVAARNTEVVGQDVARFIDWIEEKTTIPPEKLHLIGYSLGAHVAGFAGSHANNKVGRITGLDPAGPGFEGVDARRCLSPDDAHFVDVVHTFSGGTLGLSIGIEQHVGHVDIYPNGGSYQPGCNLRGALENIARPGGLFFLRKLATPELVLVIGCDRRKDSLTLSATKETMNDAMKCEQERSVHLFIDSLLNGAEASQAYTCVSSDMFERGVCLNCRKNRCNTVGYDATRVRKARSVKMFTKTRASMPFRVHHYQLKIQFTARTNLSETEPTLTVSLYGTGGSAENLQLNMKSKISANTTRSFLLVTEEDVGELLRLKLKLESFGTFSSSSLLSTVWSWWNQDSPTSELRVQKIRIRIGETQKKMLFCLKDPPNASLLQELTFVKCKNSWRRSKRRRIKSQ